MFGDNKKDQANIKRAVVALQSFVQNRKESQKQSLIDTPDIISLQITVRKVREKGSNKPFMINIPHPIRDTNGLEMCLFVKEDDKKELKQKLLKDPVEGLTKIIGLKKLKSNYSRFEDKRKLCADYDLFFADDRILPYLTKPLGKVFFEKKKQPVPVRLTRDSAVKKNIEKARDSTQMFVNTGSCTAIRVANTDMSTKDVVENIVAAIPESVAHIPRKWKNVQAIHIKTHDSVALPIYNALPDFAIATSDAKGAAEKTEEPEVEKKEKTPKKAAKTSTPKKSSAKKSPGSKRKAASATKSPKEGSARKKRSKKN